MGFSTPAPDNSMLLIFPHLDIFWTSSRAVSENEKNASNRLRRNCKLLAFNSEMKLEIKWQRKQHKKYWDRLGYKCKMHRTGWWRTSVIVTQAQPTTTTTTVQLHVCAADHAPHAHWHYTLCYNHVSQLRVAVLLHQVNVGVYHFSNQLLELDTRLPAECFFRFRVVAKQKLDFGWAVVALTYCNSFHFRFSVDSDL